ncbi:helix-turn-helix domain-containing protein [Tsuneonella sp. YG55]|uniref:Helix-turn-helix domain-containing protein n=1 Tax=Tsuneonella litorea TaxID=2976475 RepID=A0A9X2VZ95_9SPHN|nr:helix-turn-helix domain-containing protein [Tsuneonella litorea]MCT2558008.1 helix-turn-helix domain-containing protein [Tsuneonella litorea]
MHDPTVPAPNPDCTVAVHFFAPPADLEGCLTSIYRLDLAVARPDVVTDWLQPEWANLRVFSGARPWARVGDGGIVDDARFTVTGPSSRGTRFELGTTRMWGIGLLPLGWARLVGRPAAAYANMLADAERHPDFARFAGLPAVFGDTPDDEAELERIVAILRRASRPLADEERIVAVHRAMVELGLAKVADFADRAGMSVRALERVCRRHFGFPPKLLLRRQRFVRSIAAWMLGGMGKWTAAIDELYTDQAHFNHEFHEFMGMAPSEYAALPHPILSAFMERRATLWGSPAQTLDRPRG